MQAEGAIGSSAVAPGGPPDIPDQVWTSRRDPNDLMMCCRRFWLPFVLDRLLVLGTTAGIVSVVFVLSSNSQNAATAADWLRLVL